MIRKKYRCTALASLCFVDLSARLCSMPHNQSYSQPHQTIWNSMSHFFFSSFFFLPTCTFLSALVLHPAYQLTTPCMLYFFFFHHFFTPPAWRIILLPIILKTAKFERLQPKPFKRHQSSFVQCIDWCQERVTTNPDFVKKQL